jgi:mono/diheme cytochrome c family protein
MSIRFQRLSWALFALTCAAIPQASVAAEMPAKAVAKQAGTKDIERGRYLVMITGCNDCHTENFMVGGGNVPEKDRLTGGKLGWRGAWGTTYPANLRLYFDEITEEQWIQVAKEIQRRPPMPYFALNAMTPADVKAIYRYIRALGPAGEPAPKFVPADREPPQPYVMFPASAK